MKLLNFINEEADNTNTTLILVFIGISALANSLLIMFVSEVVQNAVDSKLQAIDFIFYLIIVAVYAYAFRYGYGQSFCLLEEIVRKIRVRIIDKIRSINLSYIEKLDRSELYTRLAQDTNLISQNNFILLEVVVSIMVLFFSLLYIAWLSLITSLFITIIIGSLFLLYITIGEKVSHILQIANRKEKEFFSSVIHMLDGFKEIKMNRHKSAEMLDDIEILSIETEELKKEAGRQQTGSILFFRTVFFIMLALVVFVIPVLDIVQVNTLPKIAVMVLAIWGPTLKLVTFLPILSRTNLAIDNLRELESKLDIAFINNQQEHHVSALMPATCEFKTIIRLESIHYAYIDKHGSTLFSIGPINMEVKKGEIVFIVGGNGSGKSTLLKVITSLYAKTSGKIYLDREEVDNAMVADYRELFSIIFTDFHLFDKLYGLGQIDERKIRELLKLMQLTDKTEYQAGRFTNLDLSTGQKKRLAFVAALLEEKSIYILDELAADQDPQFRKYFYEELLQNLKVQGKTIIAVTHDDHYFHTADRILKMEYGQLVDYS